MSESKGDITRLLHEWRQGSPGAENQLFELVEGDLIALLRPVAEKWKSFLRNY